MLDKVRKMELHLPRSTEMESILYRHRTPHIVRYFWPSSPNKENQAKHITVILYISSLHDQLNRNNSHDGKPPVRSSTLCICLLDQDISDIFRYQFLDEEFYVQPVEDPKSLGEYSMSSNITSATTNVTLNVTLNATSPTTLLPYHAPFSEAAVVTSACILLPLMVLCIVGNLLTIVTIIYSTVLKSVFSLFILSLCVSDFISAVISPLFLYRRTWGYDDWNLPSFFCKLYWAGDMLTSYVTALHILLFAILRLISVRWPHAYGKITMFQTKTCIILTWLVSFGAGFVPFAMWFDSGTRNRNTDDVDARWPACTLDKNWGDAYRIYSYVAYPVFFYFPMISIIILTTVIGIMLRVRSTQRNALQNKKPPPGTEARMKTVARKEKEAMLQLGFIAGSFMLGYLPITAYEIASTHSPSVTADDERYWWSIGMAGYICLRISESLNPIFYNLASGKMRKETKKRVKAILRPLYCRCRNEDSDSVGQNIEMSTSADKFSGVILET